MCLGLIWGCIFGEKNRRKDILAEVPLLIVESNDFFPNSLRSEPRLENCGVLEPNVFVRKVALEMLELMFDSKYQGDNVQPPLVIISVIRMIICAACIEISRTGCIADFFERTFRGLDSTNLVLLFAHIPEFDEQYGLVHYVKTRYDFTVVLQPKIDKKLELLFKQNELTYQRFCKHIIKCYNCFTDSELVHPTLYKRFSSAHVGLLAEPVSFLSAVLQQDERPDEAAKLVRCYEHLQAVVLASQHLFPNASLPRPVTKSVAPLEVASPVAVQRYRHRSL